MRVLSLLLFALAMTGLPGARAFSETDREVLDSARPASSDFFAEERRVRAAYEYDFLYKTLKSLKPAVEAGSRAEKVAGELGRARDLTALDHLISTRNVPSLRSFARGWRARKGPTREEILEMDRRVVAHFEDSDVAAALLEGPERIEDARVLELLLRDAAELARWRDGRRGRCRAQVLSIDAPVAQRAQGPNRHAAASHTSASTREAGGSISWRYVCGPLEKDAVRDADGFHHGESGPMRRAQVSVQILPRVLPPGKEALLLPMLRDLSTLPPADWRLIDRKPEDGLPAIAIPPGFLELFVDRRYPVPMEILAEWLKDFERQGMQRKPDVVLGLLSLMRLHETREAMEATARWAVRMAALSDPREREYRVRTLVEALGPVAPGVQVDLAALRREVSAALPDSHENTLGAVFDRAETDNATLREPSGQSLVWWMRGAVPDKRYVDLLDRGADPNQPDRRGDPPIIAAARAGLPWVKLLAERGARVGARGKLGRTALHEACSVRDPPGGRPEVVSFLLARGADVNAVTEQGSTPLHWAGSNPGSATILLAAGAKVDAVDGMGWSPLYGAVVADNAETVQVLLNAGANPNLESNGGESPYSNALTRNRPEVVAALKAAGGRLSARQIAQRASDRAKYMLDAIKNPLPH